MLTEGGIILGVSMATITMLFIGVGIWCNWNTSKVKRVIIIKILWTFIFFLLAVPQSCSDKAWNNGICPDCGVHYVPFARGKQGQKFYSCPECFKEITR